MPQLPTLMRQTVRWIHPRNSSSCFSCFFVTARIVSGGGAVIEGRVNGDLALSRALGDFRHKTARLPSAQQPVSAVADVVRHRRLGDEVVCFFKNKKKHFFSLSLNVAPLPLPYIQNLIQKSLSLDPFLPYVKLPFLPSITLKSALVCLSMRAVVSHAFFPMPHSQLFPYITSICFEELSFSHSPFFPYVTHPFVLYLTGCFCVFEQAFLLLACDGKTRAAQTPPPPCLPPPLRTLSSPLPTHPPVSSLPQPTTPSSKHTPRSTSVWSQKVGPASPMSQCSSVDGRTLSPRPGPSTASSLTMRVTISTLTTSLPMPNWPRL